MKLIDALKIVATPPTHAGEPRPILLACGFTPIHLTTFLDAHLRQVAVERAFQIREGVFGDLAGTLEGAAGDDLEAAAVVVEWEDLDPRLGLRRLGGWGPSQAEDILDTVRGSLGRIGAALAGLDARPIAVVLPTLPLPPIQQEPTVQLGGLAAGLGAVVAESAALWSGMDGVRVANPAELVGDPQRADPKSMLANGFPYSIEQADRIGATLARLLFPKAPLKGIITDLDDTVWRGILGEVGVEGVRWDLEGGAQLHGLYQQQLAALAEAGVLIAVASKNDPALVERVFAERSMPLGPESIYPFEVHWEPKSGSVSRILDLWNVGADSVVFIDDSPMELAQVRAEHPDVECLEFPTGDPTRTMRLLEDLRDRFGRDHVTDDDRLRLESIRAASSLRDAVGGGADDLESFLEGAKAEITLERIAEDDPRPYELVNKTNQFNLNGRRLTEAEWAERTRGEDRIAFAASYADKFGPLGKVAVILGRVGADDVEVDTWVMSCRAFARRLEHRCLERLFEECGVERVCLDFERTERNGPVATFIGGFSGRQDADPESGRIELTRGAFDRHCPRLYHEVRGSIGG